MRTALAIRRAILGGSLKDLDPASASNLMVIDASRDRCADTDARNAWKIAARNISDFTAAYLTPTELEGIWNWITSGPCYRTATAEQKAWVDMFVAISSRNAPDIVRLGTILLGPQVSNSETDLAYLTTVAAAAYIRIGQVAQARSLLKEQLSRTHQLGLYEFPLVDLVALTQTDGPGSSSQMSP